MPDMEPPFPWTADYVPSTRERAAELSTFNMRSGAEHQHEGMRSGDSFFKDKTTKSPDLVPSCQKSPELL
jgi:hypothetical protein